MKCADTRGTPFDDPSSVVTVERRPRASRLFASIERRDVERARDPRPARRDVAVARTFVLFDAFRFIRRRARDDVPTGMATRTTTTTTTRGVVPRVGRGRPRLRRARASSRDDAGTRSVDDALDARATTRATMGGAADASEVLQWEEVCAQVKAFAWTTRGGREAATPRLATTARDARDALARTAACVRDDGSGEAMFGRDDFDGARDARVAIEGARRGTTLSGTSLGELGSTGRAQRRLGEKLAARRGGKEALREIEEALRATPRALMDAIERCVGVPGGEVLDEASETLAAIRAEQRATRDALRGMLNETSREMARKNFAERAQVVTRLGRQCIPMKLGSAGELEGVVLDVSGTGSTVFKEPQSAVPLNNALATLSAREDAEIERILIKLTTMVREHADALSAANDALAALDVANARARHAAWLDGSKPTIVSAERGVSVRGLQHPLLLERHLAPLPTGAAIGEAESISAFGSTPEDEDEDEDEDASVSRAATRFDARDVVVPIDFDVDASIRCVTITGPNTGGKTASLKAIGVACFMARAGLYPPCDAGCEIPFFRRVIADLGDSQTLELDGGLSTFGAHLKGLQRILDTANDDSLILLDEPGSGTDPAEGAALAVAVLNALSRRSRLTVATSHYEEVKEFALASPACRVAAVEFDLNTLQPTYRLLWGETGRSNALHIAAGLGLAPSIIAEAREALAKAGDTAETNAKDALARENRAKLASALDEECDVQLARRAAVSETLEETRTLYDDVKAKSAHLDLRKQIIKERVENEASAQIDEARALFDACETKEDVDDVAEAHLPRGWIVAENGEAVPGNSPDEGATRRAFDVGDAVIVRQLGTAEAEVIDVHPETNEITVKLGRISTRVDVASGVSKVVDTSKTSWRKEQRARRL